MRDKSKSAILMHPKEPQTFSEAVFGSYPFFMGLREELPSDESDTAKTAPSIAPVKNEEATSMVSETESKTEVFPDRREVLEKLSEFVEKQTKDSPEKIAKFEGVTVKSKKTSDLILLNSFDDSQSSFPECPTWKLRKVGSQPLICFFGEKIDHPESTELLDRMIKATKISSDHIMRVAMDDIPEEPKRLGEVLGFLENSGVKILIVLGANATNYFFGARKRLTQVHGKFFPLSHEEKSLSFLLYPIFHPEYLLINPNMKKAAWEDLQIVMAEYEKLQNS